MSANKRVLMQLWVRRPDAKLGHAENASLEEVVIAITLRGCMLEEVGASGCKVVGKLERAGHAVLQQLVMAIALRG